MAEVNLYLVTLTCCSVSYTRYVQLDSGNKPVLYFAVANLTK
jgi:hypothetical protein